MNSLQAEESDKETHSHLNYLLMLRRRQTSLEESIVNVENLTNFRFANDIAFFNEKKQNKWQNT